MDRSSVVRCSWAGDDPVYIRYHDTEWGVPISDDRQLFEFLVLEGAQAGLSWITILKRRNSYREAFSDFEPAQVARFGKRNIDRLMKNPGIIRNRLKIESAINNARAFLKVIDEFGTFSSYQWRFVNGSPLQGSWRTWKEIPAKTQESLAFSKDLIRRGFTFVGPTIVYAHMQAVGLVNDHVVDCFRHREVRRLTRQLKLGAP